MSSENIDLWQDVPDIERDVTFGIRPAFYRSRAIFKKTSSNESGSFAFPINEARALGLRGKPLMNFVAIQLENNKYASFQKELKLGSSSGNKQYLFSVNESDIQGLQRNTENLAPVQFIAAEVGLDNPDPRKQVTRLRGRMNFTSANLMMWKAVVRNNDKDGVSVSIKPNERDFFGIEEGDRLSLTTIPLTTDRTFGSTIRTFFNNRRSTVRAYEKASDVTSLRVSLDSLLEFFEYSDGTIVQCIALPL